MVMYFNFPKSCIEPDGFPCTYFQNPEIPTKISGADVPNATKVKPMAKSLIPRCLAILPEWSTNLFAPHIKIVIPASKKKTLCANSIGLF